MPSSSLSSPALVCMMLVPMAPCFQRGLDEIGSECSGSGGGEPNFRSVGPVPPGPTPNHPPQASGDGSPAKLASELGSPNTFHSRLCVSRTELDLHHGTTKFHSLI